MASNSPGIMSKLPHESDNQDSYVIRGLLPDINLPDKFNIDMESGYHGDVSFVRESGYYVNTSDGASTCSSSTAETWELEGAALLVLESKSLRSFTTNDEYLFAMKEDLAEWFSSLYQNYDITAGNLFQVLETGVLLCKHANKVQEFARQSRENGEVLEMRSYFIRSVPEGNVPYREGVKPETFQARDNVSNFITWTRELGIPQVLSFETDDLVLRKNEKSVILSLLEVARVGAKLGMLAPTLVQMEQEIDAELAGEEPPPQIQIKTCDLRSLDERVRDLISRCTCPIQFPMIKVGEGKYKIGDTRSLIFVRILRNHVMVRVGGGWDTLENYLNKHDPCQCQYRGHRSGNSRDLHKVIVNQQQRAPNPNQTPITSAVNMPTSQRRTSPITITSRNRSASPQTSSRASSPTNTVISFSNSATAKFPGVTGSSSKGPSVMTSHNQQEATAESMPHPFTSSTNSSSTSQPIRSNSPRPNHLKSSSPLRAAQNAAPQISSQRTPSSSNVLKGRDQNQGSKTLTSKKSSITGPNRSYVMEKQGASYPESNSSPSRPQLALEITTSSTAPKGASRKASEEFSKRKSTSQFSETEKNGRSTPSLGTSRSRIHTSPSNTDVPRLPVSPHKRQSPSSPVKASKSSSGYGQKVSSDTEGTTDKDTKVAISELPSHLKRDLVAGVTSAVSDWLESTNEMDLTDQNTNQVRTPEKSTATGGYNNSIDQKLVDKNSKEIDISDCNQVQTPSTSRDRRASSSRIPIPRKTSHLVSTKVHSAVPVYSPENESNSSILYSIKELHLDQTGISDATEKTPSGLSVSNSEIHLAPDGNISSDEGIRAETVHTHAGELDSVSDTCSTISNTNSIQCYNDSFTVVKAAKLGSDATNPAVINTQRKLSVDGFTSSLPTHGDKKDVASKYQRRSSVDVKSQTNSLDSSWFHRSSSTSNLEEVFVNDITFSDDEEINELIKNSSLREKTSDRNMHSSRNQTRKVPHYRLKENEEILMISRDEAGHHSVHFPKNELRMSSTPIPSVTRRTYAGFKSSHPDRFDSKYRTSDSVMPKKKLSPELPSPSKSIKKLLPSSKRAKDLGNEVLATDLSSRPLEEIQAVLSETNTDFFQNDSEIIHSPRENIEMFKNMEKLFQKYREMELKAAVTSSSARDSEVAPFEKLDDT